MNEHESQEKELGDVPVSQTVEDESRLRSVQITPIRCSFKGDTTISAHFYLHNIEIQLDKFMSESEIRDFRSSYDDGDIAYIVSLRINNSDLKRTYVCGIYQSKDEATNMRQQILSVADAYNQVHYYRDGDKAVFGRLSRIQSTKILDTIYQYASSTYAQLLVLPLYLLTFLAFLIGGIVAKFLVAMSFIAITLSIVAKVKLESESFVASRVDLSPVESSNPTQSATVGLADVVETEDYVQISADNTSWTLHKDDFGNLCGYDKEIVDDIEMLDSGENEKSAIISYCSSKDGVDGLSSDDGKYLLPRYEPKWNIEESIETD